MTRDDIISMAREAGFEIGLNEHGQSILNPHTNDNEMLNDELKRFADLVAAAEREACAEICDQQKLVTPEWIMDEHYNEAISHCAAAIRARGDK
jgi:hypothetical protein